MTRPTSPHSKYQHVIPSKPTNSWWLQNFQSNNKQQTSSSETLFTLNHDSYDFVIIGGGMTGMSTAYWLVKKLAKMQNSSPDSSPHRILLIEAREHVSLGATGRNGGHLWPRCRSELTNAEYHKFQTECMDLLMEKLHENSTHDNTVADSQTHPYEWIQTGAVNIARFQDEVDEWEDFYIPEDKIEIWNQEQVREKIPQIDSDRALGGVYYPLAGQFYPKKFVHHLYEEVCEHVDFAFSTCVDRIDRKEGSDVTLHLVRSPPHEGHATHHTVCAKKLIHCTNGYVKLLPKYLQQNMIPFRGQVIITKPTDPSFGLIPYNLAFNDGYEYLIHRKDDRRIIFGGMRWISETQEDYTINDGEMHPEISEKLLENLEEWFPETEFQIEQDWTGILCNTSDMKPIVGQLGQSELVAVGFCGNGMPKSFGVGERMARLALSRNDEESRRILSSIPQCLQPNRFVK